MWDELLSVWSLPGPRSFVESIAENARRKGLIGVVAPPHMPEGLDDALSDALRLSHELHVLDCQALANPLNALAAAFSVDLRSGRAFAEDARVSGKAVLITGFDAVAAREWDATFRAFKSGCKNRTRYSALVIVVVRPPEEKAIAACGAVIHAWRGTVSRTDAMLVALGTIQNSRDPLRERLATETAVALCGWDLVGVAEEAARRIRSGADLFAVPSGKPNLAVPAKWEDGLCDLFEGAPFAKYTACRPQELHHRIWRAQVAVLFGWLEEIRLTFVSHIASALRASSADPMSWEWSQLSYQLETKATRNHQQFAERCRRVRNRLAHREVVSWEEFADILRRVDELALNANLNTSRNLRRVS